MDESFAVCLADVRVDTTGVRGHGALETDFGRTGFLIRVVSTRIATRNISVHHQDFRKLHVRRPTGLPPRRRPQESTAG
jgi:hypothetical protein